MICFLLLLPVLGSTPEDSQARDPFERVKISVQENERGDLRYTVHARFVSAGELLNAIAAKAGVQYEGLDSNISFSLVDVALSSRSLDEVLRYVLGSLDRHFEREGQKVRIFTIPLPDTPEGRKWIQEEGVRAAFDADLRFPGMPDATQTYLLISAIDEDQGRIEKANQRYKAIIENFPNSEDIPEVLLRLGRNCVALGKFEQASEYLFNLVGYHTKFARLDEGYYLLGRALLELGNLKRAEAHLALVSELFPGSPFELASNIYLAETRRRFNKTEEALRDVEGIKEKAMQSASLRPEFLLVYGKTLFETGDYRKAASILFQFFGENPSRVEAHPALFQAARASFLGRDILSAIFLAKTCQDKEGIDTANWNRLVSEIRESIHLGPLLAPSEKGFEMLTAAKALHDLGRTAEAVGTLEKLFPDPVFGFQARLDAARYRLESKEPGRCIELLSEAIPLGKEPEGLNAAFQLLGDAFLALGKHREAAEAYQGILRRKR